MPTKSLTLTLVIPVYNEEDYIAFCLRSIENQSVTPDEVIVVDNNSTDKTVEIAGKFGFVKILKEPRQHQVFAQAAGFNAATSEILGRIDADSILPVDWVKNVKQALADENTVAVTGGPEPYDVILIRGGKFIFYTFSFLVRVVAGHWMLWGSNCAFRRSAWQKIKGQMLMRDDIWEDYDLAMCLEKYGHIRFLKKLKVGNSFRIGHTYPWRQLEYQVRAVRTFWLKLNPFKALLLTFIWFLVILVSPIPLLDTILVSFISPRRADYKEN